MASYGNTSRERIETCRPEIVETGERVVKIIDHSVAEGARSEERQNRLFSVGATTVKYPDSKHNITDDRPLSDAIDIWPYIPPFGALSGHPDQIAQIASQTGRSPQEVKEFVYKAFARLAGTWIGVGASLGHKFRWGGDWDNDGNLIDQNFHDLPHLEYVGPI